MSTVVQIDCRNSPFNYFCVIPAFSSNETPEQIASRELSSLETDPTPGKLPLLLNRSSYSLCLTDCRQLHFPDSEGTFYPNQSSVKVSQGSLLCWSFIKLLIVQTSWKIEQSLVIPTEPPKGWKQEVQLIREASERGMEAHKGHGTPWLECHHVMPCEKFQAHIEHKGNDKKSWLNKQ